jgi:tRNA A-37 threonylcarbamoyl transferase component Bud32
MTRDQIDATSRTVGRYEILRQIGQGGMATVYLARQPGLEREVALKELDRFGVADQRIFASRFAREAQLAGSLNHPNIVTVLDYFEHDGRPYIAMEHVEGGSLREYLHDLSIAQVMGVLEGLLAGLTHAESRGIAHRDIKPENILVTAEGRVKLTDFGIAKAYNAALSGSFLTVAGTTVGTPKYMAPEQGTGKKLGPGTDLYAVGVVAYEMLVGRVPFDSDENPLAIVWQHVNDPVPDPLLARPDLDPRLCRWLADLLAKDPDHRPPTAHAALETLEEIVLDLLGGRWRRDARLAAPKVAPDTARPLTPARVDELVDGDRPRDRFLESIHGGSVPDATIAPRELGDRTNTFRAAVQERRARAAAADVVVAPRRDAAPRRRLRLLVAAFAAVAAIAGYALFSGGDAAPPAPTAVAPAPAQGAAPAGDQAVRQRFVTDATAVMQRFSRAHSARLGKLRQAKLAKTQATTLRLIASDYRSAAKDLAGLTAAAAQQEQAAKVRSQLRRTGRHYSDLAAAARGHWPKRYRDARRKIADDERELNRLFAAIPA